MKVLPTQKEAAPYTVLAAGYDAVMAHVDYPMWAAYAHRLLVRHHPAARSILELGCGTGSLALELQPRGPYRYDATDGSPAMIGEARRKARQHAAPIRFDVADFTRFQAVAPVDAVVLLFDGLNYLLEEDGILALLGCGYAALRPGGLFLFDQSTPANSINNSAYFEDAGLADAFDYARHSRYDAAARLHTTTFELTVGGERIREQHVQRAYALDDLRALLRQTPFDVLAAYADFSTEAATDATERIHWVAQRPGS